MAGFVSLKDYVYNFIAKEISEGKLKQNEKVNENEICKELNISRTPVREALIQLSTEGYLENIPRKGFVIRELKEEEAQEIYLILGVLDGYAASKVVDMLSEKDYKEMEFYIDSMDLAIKLENYDMYYKQQEEFHNLYISKSENKTLLSIINQVKRKFLKKEYLLPSEMSLADTLYSTNKEHREMLELFKKKDGAALEKYIREVHWEPSKAYMETI